MAYKTISEEIVRQAAEMSGPGSSFATALQYAEDYRQAGMTPAFYTDDEDKMLFVTTEEKMGGVTYH